MNRVLKFACVFAAILAAETLFFASVASAAPTVTDPASSETPTSASFMLFNGNHVEGLNGITYHTFRIPAVVKTNAGTLLAFAEGRAKSNKDYGNINVMYKRGVGNGQTAGDWSSLMQAASIGDDTIGNPTPVVDRQTGTIWLFMSWNAANMSQSGGDNPETGLPTTSITKWGQRRVFVMKSDDDGMTFKGLDGTTKPTDMTETLTPKTRANGSPWAWDSVGPGAGLYTSDGVLIIPAQFRNIYSRDHGKTWQIQKLPESAGEATITELDDGSLYRNDRPVSANWSTAKRRWISRGSINSTFSAYTPDDTLLDPNNQASVLFYNSKETDAPTRTIFLNSASTVTRTKMRFRISYDNAKTWPMSRPLSDITLPSGAGTEGGYSSMVKTADNRVGAMIETNLDIAHNDVSSKAILWHKVNLGWILQGCAC